MDQKIIVREGEKNRIVTVRVAPAGGAAGGLAAGGLVAGGAAAAAEPGAAEKPSLALPVLAYTLMGVGAASIGVGVYFEVTQVSDYNTLKNTCSPTDSCKQSDVDAIARDRVIAGVTIGVGAAAAGAGVIILLTRPRAAARPASAATAGGLRWSVGPLRGGGAAVVEGTF